MEIKEQSSLQFLGVDFPDVQFTSGRQLLPEDHPDLSVNIIPKAFLPKDSKTLFNIVMSVQVSAKDFFDLKVIAIGSFEFSGEIEEETRKSFLNSNATAIMFPYVRAFITTLTSNLGNVMAPLVLPPRFFKGTLEEIVETEPGSGIPKGFE